MSRPTTRYAKSGGVSIAYQLVGDGPRDLVYVPGWVSNIECFWEEPGSARFFERLASFSRLILFDKRGTGLSDRVTDMPTLETRMDDVRAVMDAAGSTSAALLGLSEGGPMCALFAATYPARTTALIMLAAFARRLWAPDYPYGPREEERNKFLEAIARDWGGPVGLDERAPSMASDERYREWWARYLRMSASPAAAESLLRMNGQIDVRDILPAIRVPTLVLHNSGDQDVPVGAGRYMAEQIPGAKFVQLDGPDHLPYVGNTDALVDEIEEFLTGMRHSPDLERVLATVMFIDIVGSTAKAAALGDRRWRDHLTDFFIRVRDELTRFRGREIDSAGDGVLAAFDGPARAIRCACAIIASVAKIGIQVRAGLHTGECEIIGPKLAGIAVHIGARIAERANQGEVLLSSTVRDLVAGSGLSFEDRGVHSLKGVPGEWRLFAVH
jgi:pimeloyl-ACP methyl ester carboxylesterase/class 3 adenylate cyclase